MPDIDISKKDSLVSSHQNKRLEIALKLGDILAKEEDVIGVYVWGSTAEGRATKMSDLDLVALTRSREDSKIYLFEDVAVTIDYLPLYIIRKAIRAGNLWVIESLRNCIALHDKYRIIKKMNRVATDYYPNDNINDKFRRASLEIKDALDLYNMKNYEGTILASYKAAEMLITAILYSKGYLRVKPKWILQDLGRIEKKESVEIVQLFKEILRLYDDSTKAKTSLFKVLNLYYITKNML